MPVVCSSVPAQQRRRSLQRQRQKPSHLVTNMSCTNLTPYQHACSLFALCGRGRGGLGRKHRRCGGRRAGPPWLQCMGGSRRWIPPCQGTWSVAPQKEPSPYLAYTPSRLLPRQRVPRRAAKGRRKDHALLELILLFVEAVTGTPRPIYLPPCSLRTLCCQQWYCCGY